MSDIRNYLEHPGNWGTLDGRPGLLRAMLDVLEAAHEADTAHAVALERARCIALLDGLAVSEPWNDIRVAHLNAARAIRNGDHWKGGE